MTIDPTIRGFPDYMYPNGAASAVLVQEAYVNQAAVTLGPFDVSSWPVTELLMFPSAVGGGATYLRITYQWGTQSYSVGTRMSKQIFSLANCLIRDNSINRGSTLTVVIEALPGAGTFTGDLVIVQRGGLLGPDNATTPLLNVTLTNIPAGGTVTTNSALATPGPAMAFIQAGATGVVAVVEVLRLGGVWAEMFMLDCRIGGILSAQQAFDMPSSQLRLRAVNPTAGIIPFTGMICQRGY